MSMIKINAAILLVFGIMFLGLSGCADNVLVKANYESMRSPTDEEPTMKLFQSRCADLRWPQPESSMKTSEYLKLIRIERADLNNKKCQVVCIEGYRLTDEERTLECKRIIEVEIAKQKSDKEKKDAEIAQKNFISKERSDEIYSHLAAKGYIKDVY